jgi:hypothetical protein
MFAIFGEYIKLVSIRKQPISGWSFQRSAISRALFLMSFAESRKLKADSAHPKMLVSG